MMEFEINMSEMPLGKLSKSNIVAVVVIFNGLVTGVLSDDTYSLVCHYLTSMPHKYF